MTTSRFNQDPDEIYGKCNDCKIDLPTEKNAKAHMNGTFHEATAKGGNRGHSVRIKNPTRAKRISQEISMLVDDAIQHALGRVEDLVADDHITESEAKEALKWYSDFSDAWEEFCE